MRAVLHVAVGVFGMLAAFACIEPNPNHCHNLDGDATCEDRGEGPFCSHCTADNDGCVATMPEASCRSLAPATDGPSGGSASGDDPSGSGDDVSVACAIEGPDPTCPDDRPFCSGNACVACPEAGNGACAALDESQPVCNADRATCNACTPEDVTACPEETPACDETFACVGCQTHADCPASACDPWTKTCVVGPVLWVEQGAAGCPAGGEGTEESPACSLAAAAALVPSGRTTAIRLIGVDQPYAAAASFPAGSHVVLVGVDTPTLEAATPGFEIALGSLALSGLTMRNGTTAIACQDSPLWLDDVLLVGNDVGVSAEQCDVTLRSTRIVGQTGDGITMTVGGSLVARTSVIGGNGGGGIAAGNADVDLASCTIADNAVAGLSCTGEGERVVYGSVLVREGGGTVDCAAVVDDSFLDTEGLAGTGQVPAPAFDDNWFSNADQLDFHVRVASESPFAGLAHWRVGDPFVDFEGDAIPRALDEAMFAGADQP